MASINQNLRATLLPNFGNVGAIFRILLIVTAITFGAAAVKSFTLAGALGQWLAISALAQPVTLVSLLALGVSNAWLHKLEYPKAVAAILIMELSITMIVLLFGAMLLGTDARIASVRNGCVVLRDRIRPTRVDARRRVAVIASNKNEACEAQPKGVVHLNSPSLAGVARGDHREHGDSAGRPYGHVSTARDEECVSGQRRRFVRLRWRVRASKQAGSPNTLL